MISRPLMRLGIALIAVILLLGFLQLRSCQQARQQAAQSKVARGQAGAARESAADASNVQSGVHANDMAGEQTGRENEKEIRDAKGSDVRVDPDAAAAGMRALCRRRAYRDHPRCRVQQPYPGGVSPAG